LLTVAHPSKTMKFVLLALFFALVAAAQARHSRHRRDAASTMSELTKKFPLQEWQAFWTKLQTALGTQKAEFEKQLEANKGNMDLTLDQFKDKLTEYPQIKTSWDTAKTKFTELQEKMKTTTLKDVADFLKTKLQTYSQSLNYNSVQDFMKDAQTYLTTYWATISNTAG